MQSELKLASILKSIYSGPKRRVWFYQNTTYAKAENCYKIPVRGKFELNEKAW